MFILLHDDAKCFRAYNWTTTENCICKWNPLFIPYTLNVYRFQPQLQLRRDPTLCYYATMSQRWVCDDKNCLAQLQWMYVLMKFLITIQVVVVKRHSCMDQVDGNVGRYHWCCFCCWARKMDKVFSWSYDNSLDFIWFDASCPVSFAVYFTIHSFTLLQWMTNKILLWVQKFILFHDSVKC